MERTTQSLVQALLQAGYSEEDLEREFTGVISRYLSCEQRIPPSWVEAELGRKYPLPVRFSAKDWEFLAFCTTDSIRTATDDLFGCPSGDDAAADKPMTVEELNLREHALHEHAKDLMLYLAQQKRKAGSGEALHGSEEIEEWYAGV